MQPWDSATVLWTGCQMPRWCLRSHRGVETSRALTVCNRHLFSTTVFSTDTEWVIINGGLCALYKRSKYFFLLVLSIWAELLGNRKQTFWIPLESSSQSHQPTKDQAEYKDCIFINLFFGTNQMWFPFLYSDKSRQFWRSTKCDFQHLCSNIIGKWELYIVLNFLSRFTFLHLVIRCNLP